MGGPLRAWLPSEPRTPDPRPAPPHHEGAPSTPARASRAPEPHGLPGGSPSQPQDAARAGGPAGCGIRYRSSGPIRANSFSLAGEGGGGAAPGDDVRARGLPAVRAAAGSATWTAGGAGGRAAASRGAAGPRAEARPGVLAGPPGAGLRGRRASRGGRLPGLPASRWGLRCPPTAAFGCSHLREEIRLGRTFHIS